MNNYKDTHVLYQSVLDEVHAPDDLKKRIKDMDTTHKKNNKMKWIPAAAACLAVVLVVTFVIGGFSGKGNSFVLKANAAEIGGESYVEIAKVAPVGGGSGSVVEQNKTIQNYSAVIPFSIKCDGKNIKSIKYSVQNAVFLFPYDSYASGFREQYPNQASASDKITDKTESSNKIESYLEKDKQYASYTVSFDDQVYTEFKNLDEMDKFPIQLLATISSEDDISEEAKAAFEHLHSEGSVTDESYLNETMNDFRVIYNEMLGKVTATAEVTYEDGSTDSTSLRFNCISADMQNGFVIGAKTV